MTLYGIHVFDKTGMINQFDFWSKTLKLPAQCYIRQQALMGCAWYFNQHFGALSQARPINLADIPKEVKAYCLLLGLSL